MFRYGLMFLAACALIGVTGSAYAGGDAAAGKDKAKKCFACHPASGKVKGKNPNIVGMDAGAHVKAMNEYKAGTRKNAMMKNFTKKLSDQDIADIAAYYATLK